MSPYAKRIFAAAITSVLLVLGGAGVATADPGGSHGKGPAGCFGPPGQTIVPFDKSLPSELQFPPGQEVSFCAQLGQPGGGGS